MNAIFSGIWGYVIAAAFSALLAISGTWYIVSNVKEKEIAQLKLAQSQAEKANISASLTQLQGFISRMNSASADYQTQLVAINNNFAAIKKGLSNVKPLPIDCKPDPVRLRVLTDAITATNKAAAPTR